MKILLLGSRGMLAQAITDVFAHEELVGKDLPEVDLTKPETIVGALDEVKPDVVINCAAYTAVDKCESEEGLAEAVNAAGVGALAKITGERNMTLVHFSTDYVFDGINEAGYREDDVTGNAQNAYGRTKEHGEQLLKKYTPRGYLVRTSWLYGPGGKNFVTTMLALGRSKPALKVINDQHGKPTYTYDLAEFVYSLLKDQAPFGTYHGVNEEATTWCDFAQEILKQKNIITPIHPCATTEYPTPAQRPQWSILLNTKRPLLRPWRGALGDYLAQVE